ncbi:hypothetical protein LY76DRAFT_63507 [Colletotrichum caudatum]|nr:hypothetical protein LY76DRAFT_63507 [Colletotrichum caudatum]
MSSSEWQSKVRTPPARQGALSREGCQTVNAGYTWLNRLSSQGREVLISMPNRYHERHFRPPSPLIDRTMLSSNGGPRLSLVDKRRNCPFEYTPGRFRYEMEGVLSLGSWCWCNLLCAYYKPKGGPVSTVGVHGSCYSLPCPLSEARPTSAFAEAT